MPLNVIVPLTIVPVMLPTVALGAADATVPGGKVATPGARGVVVLAPFAALADADGWADGDTATPVGDVPGWALAWAGSEG
jgi:hypothetical protein